MQNPIRLDELPKKSKSSNQSSIPNFKDMIAIYEDGTTEIIGEIAITPHVVIINTKKYLEAKRAKKRD
mgnify:CR=1 FL=1